MNAPIGTRIITAEEIAKSTANSLSEALSKLGGVHIRNNAGAPDPQLDLRGFGAGADQNTLVLLDGVRLNSSDQAATRLSVIPLQSVERIEILPGGGAVPYGGGATGGTINIVTKGPRSGERTGSLFAGRGTYNTKIMRAFGSVGGESLGLTVNATRHDADNYRTNNDLDQRSGSAVLRWQEGAHNAALRVGADRQELRLPSYRTAAQLHTDRDGTRTPNSHSATDGSYVTLSAGTRTDGLDFNIDLGYRESQSDIHDVDPDPFVGSSKLSGMARYRNISPRVRWRGSAIQWNTGLDWYDNERHADGVFTSFFGTFGSAGDASERSIAIYTQVMADLSPTTRFNAGVRAQRVKTEQRDLPPSFSVGDAEQRNRLYANELGLRQDLPSGFSIFARYSRSFRLANVDDNAAFNFTGGLLDPQRAKTNEAGLEYRKHGVTATLTAFDTKLEDEIYFISKLIIPPVGQNVNLPPTQRRGVELTANWSATPKFEIGGTLRYTQARFRSGTFGGIQMGDLEIPLVPRWTASLHASWQFIEDTRLSIDYLYVGTQRYDNDQANMFPRMPAYDVVDVRLTHQLRQWLFAATVSNLFDSDYYSYGIVSPTDCGAFCAYPQAERTLFVSAEYQFK
ncbi:MAG TPA: TonB-dependent receptor [Burkholderiales bacterium]|nr:TonB-dependent receptor [Burkholderiales bacterium]